MTPIKHEGIVETINGEHVKVRIKSQTACASCHAVSLCSLSESKDKIIDIITKVKVTKGQSIYIIGNQGQAFKATGFAYLIPVLLVLSVLSISFFVTKNEELSGILSLLVILPYFLILRTINDRLKKTFSFKIEPIND